MPDNDEAFSRAPESRVVSRQRTRLSFVWLIPIVAALAGGWVAVTRYLSQGPEITIVFPSAEGLEAGKTKIDYNGVQVGTLKDIELSKDHLSVVATAQMAPDTETLLVEDTRFWVVRPRISGGNVSGLGTLLSGAYVGMEIGASEKARRRFDALKTQPVLTSTLPGRSFTLQTPDLGSLENGTPIYFRRLKVGEIVSYQLTDDGSAFSVEAFVNAPYDQYVTPSTRFWHASGIDVSLSASGLSVQTQSLVSILIGGVAFETSATDPILPPAQQGTEFVLFEDRPHAFQAPVRDPQTYVVVFDQGVRGLTKGAPVDFRGLLVGEVVDVVGRLDPKTFDFSVRVTLTMDAERFGVEVVGSHGENETAAVRTKVIDALVARGARAQLRTGNLLSGALYVAFDFFPGAAPASVDWSQSPVELPSTPGELQALEASVASIVKKLDRIPFEAIGDDARKALADLDATLVSARGTFENANSLIEPNSVLGQELEGTLHEVSAAARAIRVLANYLERHPEALLRGKTGEAQ